MESDRLLVGRVGRAVGLRGEVQVQVLTDFVDERFGVGRQFVAGPRSLVVAGVRWHGNRLVVRFDGVADRTAAQSLSGLRLEVAGDDRPVLDDADFWDRDLIGLAATGADGSRLGTVADVLHPPGGDLLVLRTAADAEVLVPFVAEFVPEVDVAAGFLRVTPPPGLLELARGGDHEPRVGDPAAAPASRRPRRGATGLSVAESGPRTGAEAVTQAAPGTGAETGSSEEPGA